MKLAEKSLQLTMTIGLASLIAISIGAPAFARARATDAQKQACVDRARADLETNKASCRRELSGNSAQINQCIADFVSDFDRAAGKCVFGIGKKGGVIAPKAGTATQVQ